MIQCDGAIDGFENMRRDTELLSLAEKGDPACRVYAWDGPWVSLGRFQSPEKDLVDPHGTRWVIRPTGGKAVLHGHDVTVGFAVPLSYLVNIDHRSIRNIYRELIRPVVTALRACGVKAALAEDTRYSNKGNRTADCFAFASPNDIVDEATGLKVCGCALRLTQKAVLLQASVPNGKPLVEPVEVIVNAKKHIPFEWDSGSFCQALGSDLCKMIPVSVA